MKNYQVIGVSKDTETSEGIPLVILYINSGHRVVMEYERSFNPNQQFIIMPQSLQVFWIRAEFHLVRLWEPLDLLNKYFNNLPTEDNLSITTYDV